MTRSIPLIVVVLGVAAAPARRAESQITLADALREADRAAFPNRVAAGGASTQAAQRLAPLSGILPAVRLEAGYLATNDPIGVFGSTLRQRTITTANFDPDRLNHPATVGNYQGAVVVEQPLLNADAWSGRRAATFAAKASRATEEWTRLSTRVDVIRAYFAASLASERVTTIESAARAAHAHQSQAEAMVRQGVATKSDALLAAVRAGEIDAQLAEAAGAAQMARRELAVLLGRGDSRDEDLVPLRPLPSAERIRRTVAEDTVAQTRQPRADVQAANYGLEAAHADEARAHSAFVPRLNAFARYDWNSAARLYAGDRNWTAGVMASWNLFTGARDIGDVRVAAARASTAVAQADAAAANARLEVEQTRIALAVALTRLSLAERAVSQSGEAHRIVAKKYEGGLASVAELLDAQATEMQSVLALLQTRWTAITAAAERLRALGRDPGALAVLDEQRSVATDSLRPSSDSLQRPKYERSIMPIHSTTLAIFGVAVTSSLVACSAPKPAPIRGAPTRVPGTVVTLKDTTVQTSFTASGTAQPIQQATLSTKLMGTVTEVLVHEGDVVAAGATLLRIDASDLTAKSAQIAASIADAEAMRRDAVTQVGRIRALYADSAATRAQLDAAETGLQRADAAVRAANAGAAEVSSLAAYSVVRAPFAGVITKRFVDPGAFAAPGTPLLSIQDGRRLRLTANATPDVVRSLRRGQVVDATVEGSSMHATIEGIVPTSGNLYAINALVANAAKTILPGSTATLLLPLGGHTAIVVPSPALVRQGDLTGVTLRTPTGDETRWVRLGAKTGDLFEVTAGLEAGDHIVVPAKSRATAAGR